MPQNNSFKQSQSGNVFLFILLGVVLFGALSFTIARGFNSHNTSSMSDKQAQLAASEIMDYGATIARAVDRLRNKGISESDINFTSEILSRHAANPPAPWNSNPNCTNTSCEIFNPDGGAATAKTFEQYATELTASYASTHPRQGHPAFYRVSVIGQGTQAEDLIMLIINIKENVCDKINKSLGLPALNSLPTEAWQSFGKTAYGTNGYWALSNTQTSEPLFDEATSLQGADQGCYIQNVYGNTYFKVLIAR